MDRELSYSTGNDACGSKSNDVKNKDEGGGLTTNIMLFYSHKVN
jgi:hypothetical protein